MECLWPVGLVLDPCKVLATQRGRRRTCSGGECPINAKGMGQGCC